MKEKLAKYEAIEKENASLKKKYKEMKESNEATIQTMTRLSRLSKSNSIEQPIWLNIFKKKV